MDLRRLVWGRKQGAGCWTRGWCSGKGEKWMVLNKVGSRMSRRKDWVRMRNRDISQVLSWLNGGITAREHKKGKVAG